jgi:uncharacterized membrane protein
MRLGLFCEPFRLPRDVQVLRFVAFVAVLLCPTLVSAQTDRATLEGTVTDSKGGTVAGARVQITEVETGVGQERVTNEHGFYGIPGIAHGTYTVLVSRDGFQTKLINDVEVQVGDTRTLDVSLAVGTDLQPELP